MSLQEYRDFSIINISSRDFFAAAALTGLLANRGIKTSLTAQEVGKVSFAFADAALKVREK